MLRYIKFLGPGLVQLSSYPCCRKSGCYLTWITHRRSARLPRRSWGREQGLKVRRGGKITEIVARLLNKKQSQVAWTGRVPPVWGELPGELNSILFSLSGITGSHYNTVIFVCHFFLFKDSGEAVRDLLLPVTEMFYSMKLKISVACMDVACGHAGMFQGAKSKAVKDLG